MNKPEQKPEEKLDDHHCSVIERAQIKKDLADCETGAGNEHDRQGCQAKAKAASQKRERACKQS